MKHTAILKYEMYGCKKLFEPGSFAGTKVLIVGGGYQQYHAIKEAILMGFDVYVSDQNPDCPSASFAPTFWNISSLNSAELLEKCRSNYIDFAFTMQSDLPVPTVAFINNSLRDESLHYHASLTCSFKHKFREALKSSACHQPDFLLKTGSQLEKNERSKINDMLVKYKKIVIKPSDSSGSRGISILDSDDLDLLTSSISLALKYSEVNIALIEGFVSGFEFGAQTMSLNGKCVKVFVHSDVMDSTGKIPLAHRYPHPDLSTKQILEYEGQIAAAVESIGIQYGPTNVDCILGMDNQLYIIEIGARIGATCLPELTSLYSGVDWINLSIGISSRITTNYPSIKSAFREEAMGNCFGGILTSERDLVFHDLTYNVEQVTNDCLRVFECHKQPGDFLHKLRNGTDNYGRAIFYSHNTSESDSTAEWNSFQTSLKLK